MANLRGSNIAEISSRDRWAATAFLRLINFGGGGGGGGGGVSEHILVTRGITFLRLYVVIERSTSETLSQATNLENASRKEERCGKREWEKRTQC